MILATCRATIGEVGNEQHGLVNIGKAGRTRWLGKRPTVRGSVMNPNDHPHGGGEGRTSIGRKSPMSPWGKPTLGKKTRSKKARSNKFIVRARTNNKFKQRLVGEEQVLFTRTLSMQSIGKEITQWLVV